MDALVEDPVNRYTADLNNRIQRLGGRGNARNRNMAGPGPGVAPYEWAVIGFFIGLFLPSILLRYLGTGEQVSAGDRYLCSCLPDLYWIANLN